MEMIQSRTNALVLEAVKLRDRKYRREKSRFFFEGRKLFDEAVLRRVDIEYVIATADEAPECEERLLSSGMSATRVIQASESVMSKISTEKSPQGIFCIAKAIDKWHEFATIYIKIQNPGDSIILSSLQDPGNLGTIIRTCAAFGIRNIIISSDSADIYNPKTLRASMGTLFDSRIYILDDIASAIDALKEEGCRVFAASLDGAAVPLHSVTDFERSVFVIGNEGHGLSDGIISRCDASLMIPMSGRAESLNAAGAAAVLIWEKKRASLCAL